MSPPDIYTSSMLNAWSLFFIVLLLINN